MIRHYVLLATDGYVDLPLGPEICVHDKQKLYIFGFTGGLYRVIDGKNIKYINKKLNWKDPRNFSYLRSLTSKSILPSPMLWGEVGDRIYITLINLGMPVSGLSDLHTLHLHGAHVATQLDGFPEASFGVPMWKMDSMEVPPTATYYFNPEHPGTYMYHCHVEAAEHVQMGMYGALVIYPSMKSLWEHGIYKKNGHWYLNHVLQRQIPTTATNRNFAYNNIKSYFDKEYVMLLSDIDSKWHDSVEKQSKPPYNAIDFKPDFWLINGRAYPDTIKPHPLTPDPKSDINLTQIDYESYVHIKTNDLVLFRMINMGYQVVPWHIHGWHFQVIGKDASPSPFLAISQELMNKYCSNVMEHELMSTGFTATIGSGETYDLLVFAEDKRSIYLNYIKNGQDGFPSLCKQMKDLYHEDKDSISAIPLGPIKCPIIPTTNQLEICNDRSNSYFFPQIYPMHNHDDYKVTNSGAYPGGQLTLIQTDAPDEN